MRIIVTKRKKIACLTFYSFYGSYYFYAFFSFYAFYAFYSFYSFYAHKIFCKKKKGLKLPSITSFPILLTATI